MVEISNREDLERWLKDRPREDAVVIAARAALRVVPLLDTALVENADRNRAAIVLPVLRAAAAAWTFAVARAVGSDPAFDREVFHDNGSSFSDGTGYSQAGALAHAAARAAAVARSVPRAARDVNAAVADFAARAAFAAADVAAPSAEGSVAAFWAGYAATEGRFAVGAFWRAVRSDTVALENGQPPHQVASGPLWPESPPGWAVTPWSRLKSQLLASEEGWEVWTEWYEDRLHGRPLNKALEEARVLIDDELWEQGPKAVNAEIARLIVEHAANATPQGERLVIRSGTGRIGVEPAQISEADGYDNACDKVHDRYQQLIAQGLQNRFSALQPVIDDLEQSFARHRANPRRMHDTFATGVRNIAALLDANELPDDLLVTNLQRDMADGVIDIRESVPEVKRMADARARARVTLPPEQMIRAVDLILAEAGEAFEPDLREEIAADKERLEQEGAAVSDRDAPLPAGDAKDRAYRLSGRLAQLLRMARAPSGEMWAAVQKVLDVKGQVGKLLDLLNGAETFWAIIRWLMM